MNEESGKTEIDWSEVIIIFNSLIHNIENLRREIDSDILNDDDLYDAEEELNDYVTLLARLRLRYSEIPDKGELPKALSTKLREIC